MDIEQGQRVMRKSISKKTRFEVFKRDSFTCQYCGATAPTVVLEIDHIVPVAGGGDNGLLNLATACRPCNSGKGARKLSDATVISKQVDQLKEINERREQLEMLAQWRQGLHDHAKSELEVVEDYLKENYGFGLSEFGRKSFSKDIRRYGLNEIIEAIDKSADQYLIDPDNKAHRDKFLDYVPRICYWQKRERENPVESDLRRIAYTANKIWTRCNVNDLQHRIIRLHHQDHVPVDILRSMVTSATGITKFEDLVQEYFDNESRH